MQQLTARLLLITSFTLGLLLTSTHSHAQNWANQSSMNVARVEATTIDYRGNIYVFNGFRRLLQIADSVEKYDPGTKKWTTISSTSTNNGSAVTHNGAVRVGADVWIIGGRIGRHPGRVSNKVWIFNLDNHQWRRGPDLPTPGAAGGAALVDNKIHWFGGLDVNASCDVDNHFVYDLKAPGAGWKNITSIARMPNPRNHFSTAVVNGIIYAMGGQFGHDACPGKHTNDTAQVHAFNPKNNKWSVKANMPNKNSHTEPGTFVYKGDIYTTGGENALNKVWKYNPRSNKWSTFRTLPEKLVAPIARIIDGRLIVAGGGAPIARDAVKTVRSILVDNNPPNMPATPDPRPEPPPEPEPETPVPGSGTPAGATLISMEAEYFDINEGTQTHQWVHATLGNSSNDAALVTTPDQGDLASSVGNTPMLGYMVYFNHPGKHYIWVRGLGDTNASGVGNNDSIHVGLNGTVADTAYRIVDFPNQWTWSRQTPGNPVASLNVVNAGVNIVNFWMREDGLAFDKFVITSDPNYVPEDFGPDVTDGTDHYVPPAPIDTEDTSVSIMNDEMLASNNSDAAVVEAEVLSAPVIVAEIQSGDAAEDSVVDSIEDNVMSTATGSDVSTLGNDINGEGSLAIDVNMPDVSSTIVSQPASDRTVSEAPVSLTSNSQRGLFGGSASIAALLTLFLVCILRVRRQQFDC